MRLNKVSELIHNSTNHQNLDSAGVSVHFQEIVDLVFEFFLFGKIVFNDAFGRTESIMYLVSLMCQLLAAELNSYDQCKDLQRKNGAFQST